MKNLLILLTALFLGVISCSLVEAQNIEVGRLTIDVMDLNEQAAIQFLTEDELLVWKLKQNNKVYREAAARNEAEKPPTVVTTQTDIQRTGRTFVGEGGIVYDIATCMPLVNQPTRSSGRTQIRTQMRSRTYHNLKPGTGSAVIYNPHVTGKKTLP